MDSRKRFALLLVLVLAAMFVSAQEQGVSNDQNNVTQPVQNGEGSREIVQENLIPELADRGHLMFHQHLEWYPAEYSASYMVILEQKRDDVFAEIMRRSVQTTSLEISIPAGEYRYRVLGFNVLGRLDSISEWEYISIIQAMEPSIFSYSPSSFYFDRKSLRIITLEGINFFLESKFYLLRRGGNITMPDESDEESMNFEENIIIPVEVRLTELGNSAQLVFDEESLLEGTYDIIVRNPGGLETSTGPFGISVAKPFDINVSVGYFPMVSMFKSSEYILNKAGIPVVFGTSASFIPIKKDFGFFGPELHVFFGGYTSESDSQYINTVSSGLLGFHVNALYQYWFKKEVLALNGRFGLGVTGLLGYKYEYHTGMESSLKNFAFFSWSGGVSVLWVFYRQLYLEGGIDYFHIYDKDLPLGFMRFSVSAGWQF